MSHGLKVEHYLICNCKCGVPAAICTSYSPRNYGKRFEGCKFYKPNSDVHECGHSKLINGPSNLVAILRAKD
ncbi:hypothetical protein KSS87_013306 [Heliosperma pusillum]|nr:hypothetical protein KSS87_013306 [Heliosperma pusillum]